MSQTWKKVAVAIATAGLFATSLAACSSERDTPPAATGGATDAATDAANGGGGLIGIAMPTKALERWNRDGSHLVELLEAAGFETSLQYADNKTDQQISQIENMINDGAKVLVIASIDGTTLGPVLEQAAAKDVKVIAYDRLINETPNVDYYATFDNYKVGQLQGQFIEDALGLKDGKGPFNFEPFAGSPDDNNAKFFFQGAWDILKQYVDSGKLVVPSGKAPATDDAWKNIGILGWGSDDAQSEMENRLNSFYGGDTKVEVVLSPNDSLALGIAQALTGAGYKAGEGWPVLTGQDADQANVLNMLAGKQSMTVWKDTRALGDAVANMVEEITSGKEVTTNDNETYNNNVKVVPTLLLDPLVVTPDTVEKDLVDSGFYKASDLGL
ncbi:MAG: sugar ABC transporter substrate-binding protein [Cellulomonas sp.]|uniref:multiple monosaccharide ABC transporter substrate-binding protein n=1 Tax=Cellulomonas sp. A375-1 TaxID=1672219 RepID=UPI00065269FE|nr:MULTISPECIES: multiple monosaccharide ABC transporter substrate-binding protein [unclassified Cellulomonas]KMM44894.1 ABC transporter substrate-binding protein [Cellulomonas sp. A375-1]MCR6646838.1 sugar ABC transporter substrate-binding protein [Cellulomonas sp.]